MVEMLKTNDEGTLKLVAADGGTLEIPASLFRVMRRGVDILVRENAVIMNHVGRLLTLPQAAELLLTSRPYLEKILANNELPSVMVGEDRRVPLDGLLVYRARVAIERREALQELTRLSQEIGLDDLDLSTIKLKRLAEFDEEPDSAESER
ncbi:MAG: excisionase family DNA-binding protein [Chloroflexota bacterium]|nr:excisionase family DNA-binding protein [Chloroflexota bacterium]